MLRVIRRMAEREDEFVRATTVENGKTPPEAGETGAEFLTDMKVVYVRRW